MSPKRVERVLGGLESARRRLLSEAEGGMDPDFCRRPSDQDWSVAQVFEHLAQVDENVARGILAVTMGKLKVERKRGDWFRYLGWSTGAYRYVRIRRPGSLDTPAAPDHVSAIARISETRAKLLAAIEEGERRGMWSHSLKHPIFGPMPMREMLTFVADHEERHRLQIVRIKAKLARTREEVAAAK